jgi:isoleucyl-tRNA synthetase
MTTETPLNLRDTVNLPKTDFPQKANLVHSEPKRLAKWSEMNLYHEIRRARAGRGMFVLHDGPPYANADIHIGTAMNKILKDFVVKSHAMMGYDAPFVPGYDCHGLPIELHVDRKLGSKKAGMDPLTFRGVCREHALEALKRQTRDFSRLGVFGEWENPYMTMSNTYEAEIARLFGQFIRRGYVYKGARPVYWCIHDQTALAEAEVEYKEHKSPSIYVKFPLPADQVLELERRLKQSGALTASLTQLAKPVFILIWTTTPWTLPANIGIAVNPHFDYAAVDFGDEIYILAKELVASLAEKLGLAETGLVATFPGFLLDKLWARHAWIDRPSLLMLGDYVILGGEAVAADESDESVKQDAGKAGTGCVHIAPGHGHDDFVTGQQYRDALQPIYEEMIAAGQDDGLSQAGVYCPVGSDGRFTETVERFRGMQVFEANPLIVDFLREEGRLVFTEDYLHRYPHCWRCHNPVIFRATAQWFISMDTAAAGNETLRRGALSEVERVHWIPAWGRERMRNMLAQRPDWCVSRQRLWGVPIPVFYCARCGETIADPQVIDHVAAIFEKESADAWYARESEYLLPEGFKCPKCGAGEFAKEKDILDVWFDAGSSSIAVLERERKLPWPADVYLEGPDQFRGWFNSSLMVGLAAHSRAPYKTVITHGWTVDGEGRAMHKSLGNAVSPNEVVNEMGAEILRLWVASSDYREDMRLSSEILKRLVDAYRKLRNTARFALGNLYDFDPQRDYVPRDQMFEIDRWALAKMNEVTQQVLEDYKRFQYHKVYHTLYSFCTVTLSAVYFDILKDRLYTFAPKGIGRRSAQTALYEIVERLARLLAPILAFTADEIWEHIPGERERSVHLAEFPKVSPTEIDSNLLETWEKLLDVRSVVQKALEEQRERKLIGASIEAKVTVRVGGDLYQLLQRYADQLPAVFIVSQVELQQGEPGVLVAEVEHAAGKKCERCWNWSESVGRDERYPTLDERCIKQIEEGWGG